MNVRKEVQKCVLDTSCIAGIAKTGVLLLSSHSSTGVAVIRLIGTRGTLLKTVKFPSIKAVQEIQS